MIYDMFEKDKPVFVRFQQNYFCVGEKRRERLLGFITDMMPTRKRFQGKRLVCWSNDAVYGKNGTRCALCRERYSCAERVRLMLLLKDLHKTPSPAILEIGHGSFDALESFVQKVGKENLPDTPVHIDLYRDQGRLRFSFSLAE